MRIAAALAVACTVALMTWPSVPRRLAARKDSAEGCWSRRWSSRAISHVAQWAPAPPTKISKHRASSAVGCAGTAVHGKLANGLSLENGIDRSSLDVGRQLRGPEARDDVDIFDVRRAADGLRDRSFRTSSTRIQTHIIMTLDVAENDGGHDRAALFDKFGGRERERRAGREVRRMTRAP